MRELFLKESPMDPAMENTARGGGNAHQVDVIAEFLEHLAERVKNRERRERCLVEAGRLRTMAVRLRKQVAPSDKDDTSAA
jgi:hypothetical protein